MSAPGYVGSGWANKCTNQLFTLGWVGCATAIVTETISYPSGGGITIETNQRPKVYAVVKSQYKMDKILEEDREMIHILVAAVESGLI